MDRLPAPLMQVAEASSVCKCCGAVSPLYGVTDFNRNCNVASQPDQVLIGVPVYYYRCPTCRFTFTTAFDAFSVEDFRKWIYNDQYAEIDPDYLEHRPRENADRLARIFSNSKEIKILDYGGGTGLLARFLRDRGFPSVDTYDPFVTENSRRPAEKYDLVVAFEVVEHSTQPRQVFPDMISLKNEMGMVLFSTPMQPPEMDQLGMSAWFIAPRNGHVSIYTGLSVHSIARDWGLRLVSEPQRVWHLLLGKEPPDFAKHLKMPPP